jgi:hypothetical protein
LVKSFPELKTRIALKGISPRTKEAMTEAGKWKKENAGYLLQFDVTVDGIPVWGDFLIVSITNDKVEAVSGRTQEIVRAGSAIRPISIAEALNRAKSLPKEKVLLAGEVEQGAATLCYVNVPSFERRPDPAETGRFILAWHVPVKQNSGSERGITWNVWLDARNGEFLRKTRY